MNTDRTERRGRDIFYGLVAIATLIVAIIGATLAYFSMYTQSNEGAVSAQSAIVSINYEDGDKVTAQADKLIPAEWNVVKKVYEDRIFGSTEIYHAGEEDPENPLSNICIDTNGHQVCSVYRFSITSDVSRDISVTLNNEYNGFSNLRYAVFDVTKGEKDGNPNNAWVIEGSEETAIFSCNNDDEDTQKHCSEVDAGGVRHYFNEGTTPSSKSIFGYETNGEYKKQSITGQNVYELVIFLNEVDRSQNDEQGAQYQGTIKVEVDSSGDNGKISGYVSE